MLKKMSVFAAVLVISSIGVVRSQTTPAKPSVAQQLVGRWEGQISPVVRSIGMRFSPTGRWVIVVGYSGSPSRSAFSANYSIDPMPKPMHLDLTSDRDQRPALTIFEFLNPNTLRLELYDIRSGKSRPTRFNQPVELSKVSDNAIVFPNSTQLTQAEQSASGEGSLVMRSLAMSGLYYSVEMQQFPKALSQLGLSQDSTQNYSYQLQTQSNAVVLIARPKKETLKSYIAVVARFPVRGQENTTAIVCESARPSRFAPPPPQVPNWAYEPEQIQCGTGSKAINL